MTYKREIEHKHVLHNVTMADADATIQMVFPGSLEEQGTSKDVFWRHHMVDFIRLRANTKEMTIKITDQDSINDRIEENVKVDDLEVTSRLLNALHGEPMGTLTKEYLVYYTPLAIVSLYRVQEDTQARIFLEVEADDLEVVQDISEVFKEYFSMTKQEKSLYGMFFGDQK